MDYSKETILIVDDTRLQRTVIKKLFGEHFNLLEAASGEECLKIIQENTADIDLILLDLVMPGIDGFEVLRRRQNMQEFLDIPVLFSQQMTATIYRQKHTNLERMIFLPNQLMKRPLFQESTICLSPSEESAHSFKNPRNYRLSPNWMK